jgi:hypothetical protein
MWGGVSDRHVGCNCDICSVESANTSWLLRKLRTVFSAALENSHLTSAVFCGLNISCRVLVDKIAFCCSVIALVI